MTIDEYIGGLKQQIHADELVLSREKKRLELVQRIRANVEATRNSDGSSLNRSRDDLRKSGDPVRQRLGDFPGYIADPLIDKMLDRSMTERVYEIVRTGTVRDIVDYVEKLLFMRLLNPSLNGAERFIAHSDYDHFEKNAYKYARSRDLQATLGSLNSTARSLVGLK